MYLFHIDDDDWKIDIIIGWYQTAKFYRIEPFFIPVCSMYEINPSDSSNTIRNRMIDNS